MGTTETIKFFKNNNFLELQDIINSSHALNHRVIDRTIVCNDKIIMVMVAYETTPSIMKVKEKVKIFRNDNTSNLEYHIKEWQERENKKEGFKIIARSMAINDSFNTIVMISYQVKAKKSGKQ